VDTSTLLRHQAALDEIEHYLGDVETFAILRNDNAQLRALLEAIINETQPGPDDALYVKIGGGLRRLPDDMTQAIKAAQEYISDR